MHSPIRRRRWSNAARSPDLRRALDVVPIRFSDAVRKASAMLKKAGVRHALVGGLGASAYANDPQSTGDVDFLVGDEQFVEHGGGVVTLKVSVIEIAGVCIDSVSVPPEAPEIIEALDRAIVSDGVPIAPVETIVLMKLIAGRAKDHAMIIELLRSGLDLDGLRSYIDQFAPDYRQDLETLVEVAQERTRNIDALRRRLSR